MPIKALVIWMSSHFIFVTANSCYRGLHLLAVWTRLCLVIFWLAMTPVIRGFYVLQPLWWSNMATPKSTAVTTCHTSYSSRQASREAGGGIESLPSVSQGEVVHWYRISAQYAVTISTLLAPNLLATAPNHPCLDQSLYLLPREARPGGSG